MMTVNQRNTNRNQSTLDISQSILCIWDPRFHYGQYLNNSGVNAMFGIGELVARATGTYQQGTVAFSATSLSAGQTITIAGLTYTSLGVTTQAQLATAFANLQPGATTGAGTATGVYSGTLTGFYSGPVANNDVIFTSTTWGATTALTQTGTGAAATVTIVQGTAGTPGGLIPVTAANLANVIGIATYDGLVTLTPGQSVNTAYVCKGGIDGNFLVLPNGVTLDTSVGGKSLLDVLEGLGLFIDTSSVDNTKFDN